MQACNECFKVVLPTKNSQEMAQVI